MQRVHTILHDLLPPKVYYRFNPYLSEIHSLDETDPARWESMLEDVDMYIGQNMEMSECLDQRINFLQLSVIFSIGKLDLNKSII